MASWGAFTDLEVFNFNFACAVHTHVPSAQSPGQEGLPFLFLENVCSSSRPLSFSCSPAGWGGDSLSQSWAAPLRLNVLSRELGEREEQGEGTQITE